MTAKESFFCVPRTTRQTSEGPAEFPIFYYDTSVVVAAFLVDKAAAGAEIRGKGFRFAMTSGDRPVAVLAGYDYRSTTIGPYLEVGLALPVVPEDAPPGDRWQQAFRDEEDLGRDLGYYVLHLPVSTAATNAAGREMWGLPKFVTSIDVRHSGRNLLVRVDDPDGAEPIMVLEGPGSASIPAPTLPLALHRLDAGEMALGDLCLIEHSLHVHRGPTLANDPIASSGWKGTPSLRTAITSSGASRRLATSAAMGTPPRGRPSTTMS
jgi:Acetoacetate decarboxylase (ADC)